MTILHTSKPYVDKATLHKRTPEWLVTVLIQDERGKRVVSYRYPSKAAAKADKRRGQS